MDWLILQSKQTRRARMKLTLEFAMNTYDPQNVHSKGLFCNHSQGLYSTAAVFTTKCRKKSMITVMEKQPASTWKEFAGCDMKFSKDPKLPKTASHYDIKDFVQCVTTLLDCALHPTIA